MQKKSIFICFIVLICLLSLSAISAYDNQSDNAVSLNSTSEMISLSDYDNSNSNLIKDTPGTFNELSTLISKGGTINLTKDYTYADGDSSIWISKQVTLNGNGHIIDAKGKSIILDIRTPNVVLNNITFINGCTKYHYGGAVYNAAANTTITNCNFINNSAYYGGGAIFSSSSNLNVDSCYFENNEITVQASYWNEGGGAILSEGNNFKLSNSRFNGNRAFGHGAAVYAGSAQWSVSSNAEILNSTFINNVGGLASAVRLDTTNSRIDGCRFINNTANRSSAGAVYVTRNQGSVTNSYFESNKAVKSGGGLVVEANKIVMDNLTFINNSGTIGGGAYISGYNDASDSETSSNTISNSQFINNTAVYGGGGISAISNAVLTNLTIINNTAQNYGGGVSMANSVLTNSTIENNNGYHGGGVYTYNSEISNCNFTKNTAADGNAICVVGESDLSKNNVDESDISYRQIDGVSNITSSSHNIQNLLETEGGYYGFCTEKLNFSPYVGEYDHTLEILKNSQTGEKIGEYLKILIYKYIDHFDSLRQTGFHNLIWAFSDGDFRQSEDAIIQDVIKLYDMGFRIPTFNATKLMENKTIMYFNFTSLITPSAQQNLFLFKFTYGGILNETLTKETLNETSYVGEDMQFRLTVKNNGNETIFQVFINDDDYSEGLEYKSWTNETGNWTYNPGMKYWILERLDANQSASIILTFRVLTNGTLYNNATAGIANINVTNATNSTKAYLSNFTVEKIALNKTVALGDKTEFKILVTNTGEVALKNIIVTEDDFEGLSYDSYTGSSWVHSYSDGKHHFTLSNLEVGENSSFVVKFNTLKPGNITNTVVSNSSKTANNTTEVLKPAFEVSKISVTPSIKAGENAVFDIYVKNTGEIDLDDVYVVEYKYDSGLVYSGYTSINGNWRHSLENGKHKFTLSGLLKQNESASFRVIFNSIKPGNFSNTVVVGKNNNTYENSTNTTEVTSNTTNTTNTTNNTNKNKNKNKTEKISKTNTTEHNSKNTTEKIETYNTGKKTTANPILALLVVLAIIPIIRRK